MNHSTEAKLTVARNVYALLESEAAWAQGAAAFNKDYRQVYPIANEACQWCVSGAIHREALLVAGDDRYDGGLGQQTREDFSAFLRDEGRFEELFDDAELWDWNDHPYRTHAEVREALARYIASLEGQTNE